MALEATSGPELVWGQLPPTIAGNPPPDYNPDRAPSGGDLGWGVIDPRYGYKIGGWMNPAGQIGGAPANPLAILFLSASEMKRIASGLAGAPPIWAAGFIQPPIL